MGTATVLLLAAVLAQIVVTIGVGVRLGWTRRQAIREGTIRGDVMVDDKGWPRPARLAQRNFANQFEVPVVFYVLALIAVELHAASVTMVAFAWIFVSSRIAHAIVHCGSNDLRLRAPAYFVGVAAVMAMLVLDVVALIAAA
jgi:hypothetical protein